ncbi:plasmid mobilization protein [Streptomyces sp. NPDC021212]|uniref:plasmid mobilization protein n=1 Tax=Streptomyces sp. NPDC021212 TaxID=3365118 RepID=UPI00378BE401
MTNPVPSPSPTPGERDSNSVSGRARWRFGHSPQGGASEPVPAPGVAGPDRHRGAPDGTAATEGGSQPKAAHKGRPKGRARPRDKKQRRAHSVRLNPSEHALIQAGADTVGMSVAGFLAYAGLAMARDQSRTAVAIATERDVLTELFATRRQLGWAGSNLNQAAKILNSGGDVPHLTQVIADIHRAADAVRMAADKVANRQADEAP